MYAVMKTYMPLGCPIYDCETDVIAILNKKKEIIPFLDKQVAEYANFRNEEYDLEEDDRHFITIEDFDIDENGAYANGKFSDDVEHFFKVQEVK